MSGTRAGHLKAIEISLNTPLKQFQVLKTGHCFSVHVQVPVPVEVQCEWYLLKTIQPILLDPSPGPCPSSGDSQCEYNMIQVEIQIKVLTPLPFLFL